jgi:hypothetical protein
MAKINAKTTGGGGIENVGDASVVLELQSDGTTAVTIDASQNVGIGITSINVNNKLQITGETSNTNGTGLDQGQLFVNDSSNVDSGLLIGYRYQNGVAEYARLQARNVIGATDIAMQAGGGNVFIGKTSTALNVTGIQFTTDTTYGRIFVQKNLSGAVNGHLFYHNGTYVGGMNYDNTSTSFQTSSDVRLKKDIVASEAASEKIDNIRIVSHGWKHDDYVVDYGLIAQELYEIMPRAVTKGDDGEEVETVWSVDYSKLVPMLIKAHQEQQAIITDLKARIEVLENSNGID